MWYSPTNIISLALLVLRPKLVLLLTEIFQYWPCLRPTTSFIPPRYRKSRWTSHYTTQPKRVISKRSVITSEWQIENKIKKATRIFPYRCFAGSFLPTLFSHFRSVYCYLQILVLTSKLWQLYLYFKNNC